MGKNAEKLISQINQSGLLCRGYGSLPIAILFDRLLSISCKGLLCFFYACCGDSDKVVIRNDYIRSCTGFSRSAYYAIINQLIEVGLITTKNEKMSNIIVRRTIFPTTYVLTIDAQRYHDGKNKDHTVSTEIKNDIIAARDNKLGVFCDGYCVISRAVMEYSGLSMKSKVLYCYLLCCVANGTVSNTSLATISDHLNMAQNAVLHAVAELKKNGFITVTQNAHVGKDQKGRYYRGYRCNEYHLIDKPVIPFSKKPIDNN